MFKNINVVAALHAHEGGRPGWWGRIQHERLGMERTSAVRAMRGWRA